MLLVLLAGQTIASERHLNTIGMIKIEGVVERVGGVSPRKPLLLVVLLCSARLENKR
jgi:hypothetical protein